VIAFHDFHYPGTQFRVLLFAGPPLSPAASLVKQAYTRLGYSCPDEIAGRLSGLAGSATASLQAIKDDVTLGTLSVNLDSANGLRAEALYPREVGEVRRGGSLCEFTQLALDTKLAGREVLCSLFYMAYVFSHWVHEAKNLLIEINPRHECFYEKMLGFSRLGEQKMCERVKAPAVLMHLDFDFTQEQIERARRGLSVAGTTLYRYAAPAADEQLLIHRMANADR
jgi:hypothetical protein